MDEFRKKRDSLQAFVKEQIIGPGAYNKRFFFIENWKDSEFFGKSIKNECSILNTSEIIPEVPAYQYSSAILFPETILLSEKKTTHSDFEEDNQDDIIEIEEGNNESADDENLIEDTNESLISKQQNYPNQLGLSFVIGDKVNILTDLSISLSFRKYKQYSKKACYKNKLGIWIPENEVEIKFAIEKYFNSVFKFEERDSNVFVTLNSEINKDKIYEIDYSFLSKYLKDTVVETLSNVFKEKLVELKRTTDVIQYGIKAERDILFYSIKEKSYNFDYVYTLYDNLMHYIKSELETDIKKFILFKDLIKQLEIFNQLKNLVTDLKSVYKDRQPTPIWKSKLYDLELSMPKYDSSKRIDRKKACSININDSDLKDLEYQVQYIRKENKIYVKIILINRFAIKLKDGEPIQLNKKDEANIKSFFGVELKVSELKDNCLLQYNPPQLLDIDEEDNFNKLLYRNFIDYGEGYNTSVSWGVYKSTLKFISTDFLPEQETPKVDFVPSKIVNGKIVSRILNDDFLSIRYLSTLSDIADSEVISSLKLFINEYQVWINEKKQELRNDDSVTEKGILESQLRACENDYNRLLRNVNLLANDNKALSSFRIMNTAMFMQLHHSILKKQKHRFQNKFQEQYYKDIEIEKEYKWRSFQLAFILINIDAFVRPHRDDKTVEDVFDSGWPERNEIADLVWFPTGGGKTEAYLGIIAFAISYRRFTKGYRGFGTTVLMRYTLRLLTLQQFQRATLLICALEVIRKDDFFIPHSCDLGDEKITIGLFVGSDSLPNTWNTGDKSMVSELNKISSQVEKGINQISTNLPFTDCPWCGYNLFVKPELLNIYPNHINNSYGVKEELVICCNNSSCSFSAANPLFPNPDRSLPIRLFDEDIYKFPPTLLFGTVDKFAAFANNISTLSTGINKDSRRFLGKGYIKTSLNRDFYPPELIIQDELHLLLGPLGSAVGLFEKSIDYLCSYTEHGVHIRPKIITSTATTRNTDKQIFALFNRRSEIFPKQGITSDDSFFAYYERNIDNVIEYESNRKYIGVLPVGKTQVWMQLRITSIALVHRLKYLKETFLINQLFETPNELDNLKSVFDYYHTVLSYFNSLKDVGKTQSQLNHYLPGDVNYITKNVIPWSFLDRLTRDEGEIKYSELTGRLTGEEVKTNLSDIESKWELFEFDNGNLKLKNNNPPEFVISTNMISVGIDVSRFNTMIISSMPRNVAEYIQASSRVARDKEGIVFTIHHPFRSRDISHYQKFKEFHEKFYSYVEPISVTPFASKALDRYLAMFTSVLMRHNETLDLRNNEDARNINDHKIKAISIIIVDEIKSILNNSEKLEKYLRSRQIGLKSSIDGIINHDDVIDLDNKLKILFKNWTHMLYSTTPPIDLKYRDNDNIKKSLFISVTDENYLEHWKVSHSLREIAPSTVIKTVQQ
ncbi:MAG: helicase-related protein [Bacteroidota bacterium]